ncbi:MAG TPA: hypothetical protein VKI44_43535 [Acetobacteraceae bacterium]|nr:hypothetical protein [Acetobacteraceae bacterium]
MTDPKANQAATDQKTADPTKKPVPDVNSDELSEADVSKVTGGAYDAFNRPKE